VTLKHGNAVTAYVHWIGLEMQSGRAGGGGYDRATAACAAAARKLPRGLDAATGMRVDPEAAYIDFRMALERDGGARWSQALERDGFTVCNVIA
jgi:hypothetical protein